MLHTRKVLTAVLRRGVPNLVEATLVPTVLFLSAGALWSPGVAMAVVLVWGFGAIGRRLVLRRRVPALLGLATVGLTVRTVVGLASGSTFAYFVQPVATTVALAAIFAGSVLVGRPVIARLAHDFVPLGPDVAERPAVAQLFAGLTMLWAGVHVLTAATTFSLLVTLPVPAFVALKTVACAAITVGAIAITVVMALRTARAEQLVFQEA
ncbi:MAG: VC0807 family protein [Acidimicrobiia bacterium]